MLKPWLIPLLVLPLIGTVACDDKPCPDGEALVRIATDVYECESASSATKEEMAEVATWRADMEDANAAREEQDADATAWAFNQEEGATEAAWERIQAATWYPNTNCDPNYGATHDANGYAAACVPGDRDYDCPELHDMGIGDIDVTGSDWQRLDGRFDFQSQTWDVPPDGVGCEWTGE